MKTLSSLILLFLLLNTGLAHALDKLELKGTDIRGNKELPNVLYIVPWKQTQAIEIDTPPYQSVLEQPFQTLERSSFKRHIKYYNELYPAPVAAVKPSEQ